MMIDDHLRDEILHLKSIYDANIPNISLQPVELSNEIKKQTNWMCYFQTL